MVKFVLFLIKKSVHFIHWKVYIESSLCSPSPRIPFKLLSTVEEKDVIIDQCTIICVLSGTRISSSVLLECDNDVPLNLYIFFQEA